MPIYEFYCKRCNTIYNFFSRTVNTGKTPLCPGCGKVRLARQMSVFSTISSGEKAEDVNPFDGLDEKKVEREMAKIAAAAEKADDEDPRAAAQMMRKFSDATGMKMGEGFYEALRRIEKGEDPEKVEAEMGADLMREGSLADKKKAKGLIKSRPNIDETLYEL